MRIISLAPSVTEILFALGLDDEIVGVTKYCDFPAAAELKPKIGGWMDIDFERVIAAKPDIVFTSTIVQQKVLEQGKALGLNMVHTDPRMLQQIFESIIFVGSLVGRKKEAQALVENMQSDLEEIKVEARNKPKVKVYVEEWPMTVSCNWVPDLIEIAGGISLGKSGELSRKITTEDVKKFDPEVIVISWCGFGQRVLTEKITERQGWNELTALKNNKIFVVDDSLFNRPGPRIVEGARLLSQVLNMSECHPIVVCD